MPRNPRELLHMTFQLPGGVSREAEKVLWQRGILTWNDFCLRGRKVFSPGRTERMLEAIKKAEGLVAACSLRKLIRSAPPICILRLGPLLLPQAAFLDIETAGLAREDPPVTAVVLHRNCLNFFVDSVNLEQLPGRLRPLRLLVTFHGRRFDLPRLRYHLGLRYRGQHIDLVKLVRACGLKGALKSLLRQMGFPWPEGIPTAGEDAPRLWNSYRQGDLGALRCLLAYHYSANLYRGRHGEGCGCRFQSGRIFPRPSSSGWHGRRHYAFGSDGVFERSAATTSWLSAD